MRALGVDLGERRIGVAVSDAGGILASPYTVIERSRPGGGGGGGAGGGGAGSGRPGSAPVGGSAELAALVAETGAEVVVVGLPLSLDGRVGPAARAVLAEARALAGVLPVPVETQDERLTTVTATQAVGAPRAAGRGQAAGRRAGGGRRAGRDGHADRDGRAGGGRRAGLDRRPVVDDLAAAVLLQSWLDRRRAERG